MGVPVFPDSYFSPVYLFLVWKHAENHVQIRLGFCFIRLFMNMHAITPAVLPLIKKRKP